MVPDPLSAVPSARPERFARIAKIAASAHTALKVRTLRAVWAAALTGLLASLAHSQTASFVYQGNLPNVPRKAMTALIVDYPPGASSAPHRHAKSGFLFAYVLAGTIRSQVDGGPIEVFAAGRFWTEGPGAHHTVSENASDTESARLLVVFVADPADTLTTYER